MKDFFISYTGNNRDWASWIAWELEESKYSTIIQEWDFLPGTNFVVNMHNALQETERMIAVISEDYFNSVFCSPEWSSVFSQDPTGTKQKLIPVRVSDCSPQGLLKTIVWIDLVGLSETDAKKALLDGVKIERKKPHHPPEFPGDRSMNVKPAYPQEVHKTNFYIPKIKKARTDLEISNFIEASFQNICQYFSEASKELMRYHPELVVKFQKINDVKFICEAFFNGTKKAACKVWLDQGSYHSSSQICFSEGYFSIEDGSYNESLGLSQNLDTLSLQALMRFGWEHQLKKFDLSNLSSENAAEYLWMRFVIALEG